ncbi:MAG: hypothetical protein WC466_09160 [Candidatus Izemoplasmatales bacterium]
MEENIRKQIIELIRKSINEVVYDEIKKMPQRLHQRQEEIKKTKSQREQDAHDALFGKNDEEISYRINIRESEEKPKISVSELEQFKNDFISRFPNVSFYKQNGPKQNGQIVDFPIIKGKKDAFASGKITFDKDEIGFTMSIVDGLKIVNVYDENKLIPFEIRNETKDVFSKMLNLYEQIFKKKFNDIVNSSTEEVASTDEIFPQNPEQTTPPQEETQST